MMARRWSCSLDIEQCPLTPLDAAAARADGRLRELLGLVDVLRVGLVWERTLAVREISRRLEAS